MVFSVILIIGWLYVTVLMAASEASLLAGLSTFLLYGVLPLSILLYLLGSKARKRRRAEDDKNQLH